MFQNHSNCLELFGISQKRGFAQSYGLDTMCRHPTENSQIRYRDSFMFSYLLCCLQQQNFNVENFYFNFAKFAFSHTPLE